jgi:hypothetical protein
MNGKSWYKKDKATNIWGWMEYSLCPNMVVILGFCLGIKEK